MVYVYDRWLDRSPGYYDINNSYNNAWQRNRVDNENSQYNNNNWQDEGRHNTQYNERWRDDTNSDEDENYRWQSGEEDTSSDWQDDKNKQEELDSQYDGNGQGRLYEDEENSLENDNLNDWMDDNERQNNDGWQDNVGNKEGNYDSYANLYHETPYYDDGRDNNAEDRAEVMNAPYPSNYENENTAKFNTKQEVPESAHDSKVSKNIWERRPPSFYQEDGADYPKLYERNPSYVNAELLPVEVIPNTKEDNRIDPVYYDQGNTNLMTDGLSNPVDFYDEPKGNYEDQTDKDSINTYQEPVDSDELNNNIDGQTDNDDSANSYLQPADNDELENSNEDQTDYDQTDYDDDELIPVNEEPNPIDYNETTDVFTDTDEQLPAYHKEPIGYDDPLDLNEEQTEYDGTKESSEETNDYDEIEDKQPVIMPNKAPNLNDAEYTD